MNELSTPLEWYLSHLQVNPAQILSSLKQEIAFQKAKHDKTRTILQSRLKAISTYFAEIPDDFGTDQELLSVKRLPVFGCMNDPIDFEWPTIKHLADL